ncbi:MAG TPA: hypothetical protein VK457_23815 [Chloroflexota bacterium]|nr:hypothetical protein [Chloroflexota bacterium]
MRATFLTVWWEERNFYGFHVEVAEIMYSLKDVMIAISKDKGRYVDVIDPW